MWLCILTETVETKNRQWFNFPAKGINSRPRSQMLRMANKVCVF